MTTIAQLPYPGKRVRVISKRSKIPCGTEGVVIEFERSNFADFSEDLRNYRIKIRRIDGKIRSYAANAVEVIE